MESPRNYKQAKLLGYEIFRIFENKKEPGKALVVMRPKNRMDSSEHSEHFCMSLFYLNKIGINVKNYKINGNI